MGMAPGNGIISGAFSQTPNSSNHRNGTRYTDVIVGGFALGKARRRLEMVMVGGDVGEDGDGDGDGDGDMDGDGDVMVVMVMVTVTVRILTALQMYSTT